MLESCNHVYLVRLPKERLSLLDYIAVYWPYVSDVISGKKNIEVEVMPGMEFMWEHPTIEYSQSADLSKYTSVMTDAHVPFMDTEGYKLLMSKEAKYMDLSQSVYDKQYEACIYPGKDCDRLTWCRLLSAIPYNADVVIVDESFYSPGGEGYSIPAIDKRGLPLDATLDVIRKSKVVIGPSSGIVALAAYAGVNFLTYTSSPVNPWKTELSYNPFATYGVCFKSKPHSSQLAGASMDFISKVAELRKEDITQPADN
jgi:hypothetical protein